MNQLNLIAGIVYGGVVAVSLSACSSEQGTTAVTAFTGLTSPTAPGSLGPHLAVTTDDTVVMSWLEPADNSGYALRYSLLQADEWSAPTTVATGDDWFVNASDFPSVVPISAQQWAAHWLVKRPGGNYAYDVALAISADGGKNWTAPITPHTDNTATEHGFVTLFPWLDALGAVWLDGRYMTPDAGDASDSDGQGDGQGDGHGDGNDKGAMTLRFARLGYDGKTLDDGEIDNLVCDCCQTDVAMTAEGPVVVYRDRTVDEIRDISVARYVNGGWTAPVTVSDDQWRIPACPVNGPTITANGENVVVAWYGAPNRESRIKLAWSRDSGQTFTAPVVVDDRSVRGRVDVALLSDGSAAISWVAKTDGDNGQLRMRTVTSAGDMGPIEVITEGTYSRSAGFPQMVRAGNRLVFAWPEHGEIRQVRTAFSQ